MNKAVFLDRDGVINRERGEYTWRWEDFEILPGVVEGLKSLQVNGYLLIVITNQGGIAKGLYTRGDVEQLHARLKQQLSKSGVSFAEIYYCPHHNDFGKCLCRKPGSLLLEKAIVRFDINVQNSFFIGDKPRDIQASEAVGLGGVLVEANSDFLQVLKEHNIS